MKAFLDTSVLVPVFYADHVHHEASRALFLQLTPRDACCGAHSPAEVYSTLTRMPAPYRLNGEQAMLFLGDIRERLHLVALNASETFRAIRDCAAANIAGGALYDSLLAHSALKAKAETIYTWNIRHYRQFGPQIADRLKTP